MLRNWTQILHMILLTQINDWNWNVASFKLTKTERKERKGTVHSKNQARLLKHCSKSNKLFKIHFTLWHTMSLQPVNQASELRPAGVQSQTNNKDHDPSCEGHILIRFYTCICHKFVCACVCVALPPSHLSFAVAGFGYTLLCFHSGPMTERAI